MAVVITLRAVLTNLPGIPRRLVDVLTVACALFVNPVDDALALDRLLDNADLKGNLEMERGTGGGGGAGGVCGI